MSEPTKHAELERLLNASVDGDLCDEDEASLQVLLRADPTARQRYMRFMQLHAELHWDHGAAASLLVTPEHEPSEFSRGDHNARLRIGRRMLLAISMGTLAAGWLLAIAYFHVGGQTSPTLPAIGWLEMTHGTASFQTAHGESLVLSGRGQTLPAGSLLLEGESSAAQWRFLDGTLITLSGDAELTFSDDGQKLLRIRRGILTAEVQPQPSGAPLVVETPTARVEVLGTVFTLATESEQTRVNVLKGRVRLMRLVDGETVEIPSEHSCVASLDARAQLQPKVPGRPAIGWRHRFAKPPPERWKGEWLPAEGDLPARVRAVACLVGRKHEADGSPIVHYGISVRKVDEMSLGSLPPGGALRIRCRTEDPAQLHLMLGLNRDDGGFGGNFEAKLPLDAGIPDGDGWREIVVPLADFRPLVQRWRSMPVDARPYLILVTTFDDDAGLEVSELAIEGAETSSKQ